jgi:hypothetical protein
MKNFFIIGMAFVIGQAALANGRDHREPRQDERACMDRLDSAREQNEDLREENNNLRRENNFLKKQLQSNRKERKCIAHVININGSPTYNDRSGYDYSGRVSRGAELELLNHEIATYHDSHIKMIQVKVLRDSDYGRDQVGKIVSLELADTDAEVRCINFN